MTTKIFVSFMNFWLSLTEYYIMFLLFPYKLFPKKKVSFFCNTGTVTSRSRTCFSVLNFPYHGSNNKMKKRITMSGPYFNKR